VPLLTRSVGVAVDLAGCPNRCRHCYLGSAAGARLDPSALRWIAELFSGLKTPGQSVPYFDRIDVASWFREPDYSDDYKELYELEAELSGRTPRRYELLSAWRLARDPDYAPWAREHGPRTCQLTFFGLEEVNDAFHRRRGAFQDNLAATERLLDAGMIPRWQIILVQPGQPDLPALVRLAEERRLRERVADLGAEFDLFCHPPWPGGEAWGIEDLRIEQADLALIPDELMAATRKHFDGRLDWETEAALAERVLDGGLLPAQVPHETWFLVNPNYDVFSNYGEVTPAWRLGNLMRHRLGAILETFETDATPGLWASFHVPDAELAERFARRGSTRLYSPADLKARWVHLHCEARARPGCEPEL